MAGKSMLDLAKIASEISSRIVDGVNIEQEIVKVAAREDLDAAEIRTVTQRVNKGVIVPMHQKVASKRLPLGATFKTASADNVISVVERLQDAPRLTEPTLPPRRDGFKEAEIKKHISDTFGPPSPHTPMLRLRPEVYADSPELVETISSVETATRVVEHLEDRLSKARDALADREVAAHNLLQDARKMASSLVQQDTPPQIVRQAASECPELLLALAIDMRRGHVKEAATLPAHYVIDSSHPFVKLARATRDAIAEHTRQAAEVDRIARCHLDARMKRAELERAKRQVTRS